jgi:fatty acid desaturase
MPQASFKALTASDVQVFLHPGQWGWNAIAFVYTLGGYLGGIALLLQANPGLNAIGVLMLTHSLILSAYLAHELMHGTIFEDSQWNSTFGNVMLWLNGGCYGRFHDLAKWHIAHHVSRVDFSQVDFVTDINQLPRPLRSLLLLLEWLYIPVLAFLPRLQSTIAPFRNADRRDERYRIAWVFTIRFSLFTGLGFLSIKALFLYFLAYIGMVTVLRFMDAFQHTYEVFPISTPLPNRDRAYEQANTFSNLLSQRYAGLNLLLLNFGYHNAHHQLMKCPWYRLPALDRHLFTGDEVHYVPLSQLLRNYHRFRIQRMFGGQGQAIDDQGNPNLEAFYGAIEVSFLVLPA